MFAGDGCGYLCVLESLGDDFEERCKLEKEAIVQLGIE